MGSLSLALESQALTLGPWVVVLRFGTSNGTTVPRCDAREGGGFSPAPSEHLVNILGEARSRYSLRGPKQQDNINKKQPKQILYYDFAVFLLLCCCFYVGGVPKRGAKNGVGPPPINICILFVSFYRVGSGGGGRQLSRKSFTEVLFLGSFLGVGCSLRYLHLREQKLQEKMMHETVFVLSA